MIKKDVIKPCSQEFHPQTNLHKSIPQASTTRLYFVSGVHLYALNASNGSLLWCQLISNAESRMSQESALLGSFFPTRPAPPDGLVGLAVQNDRVFVTTLNSSIYAFDASTGKQLWQQNTGFANGIPTVSGDTLYVPSATISALSTKDGSLRWSYPTHDVVTSQPVLSSDILYTGSFDDAIYALNINNGKPLWIYHTDGRVYVAPIVQSGVVYAGAGNDGPRLFAIDAQSGKLLWHTNTIMSAATQLAVADELLYTTQNNTLVGIDPQNGNVIWQYNDIYAANMLTHEHTLYAASNSGILYAFDTRAHMLLWKKPLRTLSAGQPTRLKLIGAELYVGFNDLGRNQFATIHAINIHSGDEDWSTRVNWNVSTLDLA